MDVRKVECIELGTIGYGEAWDLQERMLRGKVEAKARISAAARAGDASVPEEVGNHLLFCEHPPVYTMGKSGDMRHVLLTAEELADRGISFYHTNRGGDITFHGPGQVVGYPLLDLEQFKTDLGWFLRSLEEVVIRALQAFGVKGARSPGETGVWIDPGVAGRERKICAMGVRCSRWLTMHGFALNVNTDLSYFSHIIPCGIQGKQVTSLQRETGVETPMEEVKVSLQRSFEDVFGCTLFTGGS